VKKIYSCIIFLKNLLLAVWAFLNALFATLSVIVYLAIWDNDGKKRFPFGHLSQFWGRWVAFGLGLKMKVEGLENIDRKGKYIFVANHESSIDVVALMKALPLGLVTMTKHKMRKVPVLGYGLYKSGVIFVNREEASARQGVVEQMVQQINSTDLSLYIFPEGKRGDVARKFKTGAIRIAIQTGVPIVPIALIDTDKFWPLGNKITLDRSKKIKIIIGEPIPTDYLNGDVSDEDIIQELCDQAQAEIYKNIPK
jgi:1-acyl-sn-glycerol-3-phosphate acyltransferase